ncbi:discoidin domain-containing receptor 2-like [Phymastichus coffea]|uniref:discoidin domain-containing receptor 2-like n=1 Tax=Phymastichus coffea TaxID=108790 RepID=UPI00273BCAEF|nr:discoidin domain-containing receptor 2-like [Phymastichus coffea]XP_058790513.1 discoidin domain-containing receptor 2-like [Phymastichus coffea]XP_058790514.1 discoidin domain-containing receptor 2-like [Phymastichus coffea]XP_058790515.1 discoidin domain-containing receptor 2-like [Phymastichus coffea]XP_058790516.1 discoidin domain-containing receptor 2-like [Phymastichus coffea]
MDYPRLLLLCALQLRLALAIDLSQCIGPLGMGSGAIPDTDITASSSFDSGNVGPHHGRLGQDINGGAWCPKSQITTETTEWIEIDLRRVHVITATGSQGRFGNGQGVEFAEAYLLEYWRPALGGKWVRYRDVQGEEVIQGNKNTYLESKHSLEPPIWAQKIRFLPYSFHRRTVCMRVEVYGCPWNDGIVYYSMPQGDKRGNWEFYDAAYDGYWDHELRHGLGQLTDGRVGPDNFKLSHYDSTKEQGWVGWRNDTRERQPLEIKFEFDHVREFSAVHIFCNNQFTKDVQVFSDVSILFSIGGKHYTGDPIVYNTIEDKIFEYSRNVTIKLHHRIGKFVKLRFGFAARWIMISEITFDSDMAHGNFTPESTPTTEASRPRERGSLRESPHHHPEIPVSTAKQDDPTYMAVIIGVLTAVILLLAVAIFFIVSRHRQRKNFASPLGTKSALPPGALANEAAYGTAEKDPSLMAYRVEDLDDRYAGAKLTTLPRELNDRLLGDVRLDDYQEPFHESGSAKYREPAHAAYYGYSTVVIDNKDLHDSVEQSDATYDYAVPMPVPSGSSDQDSIFSKSSRGSAKACLQSFFPPPPPPMSAPPSRGASNLTYSSPPSPDLMCDRNGRAGSKRRDHSLHRYA